MHTSNVFISPRMDVIFKAIFGKASNVALLQSLIASVTGIAKESLVENVLWRFREGQRI